MMETFITLDHNSSGLKQWIHVTGYQYQRTTKQPGGYYFAVSQGLLEYALVKVDYYWSVMSFIPLKGSSVSRVIRRVLFSNFMHVCLTRLKPTICSETKRKKRERKFSHFQHSRSHLMLPVLEWQSLLPLDKVYPFLFEMKMSVISFEIDDSLHAGPINEKLMRLSSLF